MLDSKTAALWKEGEDRMKDISRNHSDGSVYEELKMINKCSGCVSPCDDCVTKQNEVSEVVDEDLAKEALSTTAIKVLSKASALIDSRGKERDKPDGERSMYRCVSSFNRMTGHTLTETEGWKFMLFLKLARMEGGAFRADDYEDCVAYAALMSESEIDSNLKSLGT